MATRSFIGKLLPDGRIRAIYCHSDGYPEWNGAMLVHYYNTDEKIDALLNLGDLSSLEPSIEKPAGHSFDLPHEGYTIAYRRDRGPAQDDAQRSVVFSSDPRFRRSAADCGAEYAYLWKDGEWWVCLPSQKGYAMVDKSMSPPRAMPRPITDVPSTAGEAW